MLFSVVVTTNGQVYVENFGLVWSYTGIPVEKKRIESLYFYDVGVSNPNQNLPVQLVYSERLVYDLLYL